MIVGLARLLGVVLLLLSMGARTDVATGGDPERIFRFANEAFREGAAFRDSDRAASATRLGDAIEAYRGLIEGHGLTNGKLYYNLGNAHMMRNEIGRAIVAYRRALRLSPHDENLRANLSYARSRVETSFEVDEASHVGVALLVWQDGLPVRGRVALFVLLFGLGWVVGLIRLSERGARMLPRWVMAALLVLATLPGLSLALTVQRDSGTEGVVTSGSAMGRKGPDRSYEPSFTRALDEGVEFELLEVRPGWVYVRLPDGRTTWLIRDSVDFV